MSWHGAASVAQLQEWIRQSHQHNPPIDPVAQRTAAAGIQQWGSIAPTADVVQLLLLHGNERDPAVPFFALTVLQRRPGLTPNDCRLIQQALCHQYGGGGGGTTIGTTTTTAPHMVPYMRNKVAALLGRCWVEGITMDESSSSQSTTRDWVLSLANQNPALFLQMIASSLDEIHCVFAEGDGLSLSQHSGGVAASSSVVVWTSAQIIRFKDVMKGYHNPSATTTTVPTFLQQIFSTIVRLFQNETELLLVLAAIRSVFQWTDLSSLGGSGDIAACLQLMLLTTRRPDTSKASLLVWKEWLTTVTLESVSPELASSIVVVMSQLVESIHTTGMLPYASSAASSAADTVDGDTMEVIIEMANVINLCGFNLVPFLESKTTPNPAIETLFHQVLDLFFRAFAYDDIDVTTAVLPLATRLTAHMEEENNEGAAQQLRQHLALLLNTLYEQMKYPDNFQYDYEDENDAEEEVFRTELTKVYNKVVRAAPATCLQFVSEATSALMSSSTLAAAPTPSVEATLRLLYHYCEGIRPAPGLKVVIRNELFCALLQRIHESDIAMHSHREVVCLYYETAVRYYPFYLRKDGNELLSRLLGSMSGPSGLQHEHSRIRSRCCYLLLRLVKSTISLLRPFVETAVTGILGLLSNQAMSIRPDDTMYLFETIGLLLGKTGLDANDQEKYLTSVLTPHVRSIEQIRTTIIDIQAEFAHVEDVLSGSIAAVAHLSKGFSKPAVCVKRVLTETLNIALTVLEAFPQSEKIRNKSMVLMQRMILCVGPDVLPKAPQFLHVLINHCSVDDVAFVSQLLNQLCMKFKEHAAASLDSTLVPFLQKCEVLVDDQAKVVGQSSDIPPHLRTEQLSVKKLTYTVLQHVVSHNVSAVLFSNANDTFERILRIMNDGAVSVEDPTIRKTCIKFFRELVIQWSLTYESDNDGSRVQGFFNFVLQSFIPNVFRVIISKDFDEKDAGNARVMGEYCALLHSVHSRLSNHIAYEQCITVLASIGRFNSVILQEVMGAGDIEKRIRDILAMLKGDEASTKNGVPVTM